MGIPLRQPLKSLTISKRLAKLFGKKYREQIFQLIKDEVNVKEIKIKK